MSAWVLPLRSRCAASKLSNLPVYLVTADVEARKKAELDGINGILLKPVTLDSLKALLA